MSHSVLTDPTTTAPDLPELIFLDEPPRLEPIAVEDRRPGRARALLRALGTVWRGLASASEWVFGAVALVGGLAVLSAVPVLQLLSFGYLLESGGRVARTGRLRDGFVGVRKAARVGSAAIGTWLVILPVRFVSMLAVSAQLVDPGGPIARRWRVGLLVLTILTALHIVAACARGGKLRYFLWPLGNPFWLGRRLLRDAGGFYAASRDAVWSFVASLRLPYYFRLGFLGFIGTLAWIILPVSLIAVGRKAPPAGLLGALLMGIVALALPFLQARFGAEGRFRAIFEYRGVRERFRHAPWAFAVALLMTLVFAVPLYLLKIQMIPRETVWVPSLVFLGFIFPARLITGWAYARSCRRERPRHWFFRVTTRLGLVPVAAFYVLIVYFSQFLAWNGIASLYEQHAFLLPVPFLDM